ncbi:MAG: hypothetical protein HOC71_08900, partial [Candidatus Latescibacteria bacterium]|nr:hypothetical protein [Candidatus Latescibacterota bacterium]
MKRSGMLVFLFAVLIISLSTAQEYRNWKGYPPVYDINGIIEFKGLVYCATKGGMFVYNPSTQKYKLFYKNNDLVSNNVLCIGATSKEIYIGFQEKGLWRFDPETEIFKQVLFPEYHTETAMHVNGMSVYDIFAKNDSILYVGHEDGLDMLNLYSEELRSYTNLGPEFSENTAVNQVKIFDDKIWVCTPIGLAVADENNPNLEFEENWKNYTYISTAINCIIRTKNSHDEIFLGTNSAGIVKLDEVNDRIVPTNLTGMSVNDFYEFKWQYWAATDKGLYKKQISIWNAVNHNNYLPLKSLAAGGYEKLWVGTMQNGLQCYSSWDYLYTPPHSEMRSETFYDLDTSESDVLWAATAYRDLNPGSVFQGLYGETWTEYSERDHTWSSRVVTTLVDNGGLIWAGTWGFGLFVLNDDGSPDKLNDKVSMVDTLKVYIRPTQADYYIVCSDIAEDSHGNIWVANYQADDHKIEAIPTSGAVVLDSFPVNQAQNYSPAYDDLPTAMIFKICPDEDGWVWLGTANKGVAGLYVGDDPFDKEDTEV